MSNINLNRVYADYVRDGLVTKVRHPNRPFTLYNYTPKCQFEELWDEYTMAARGLVVHDDGKVVVRPFAKFFNLEEPQSMDLIGRFETTPYFLSEKMDGSMVTVTKIAWDGREPIYSYDRLFKWEPHREEVIVNTRGSFTSDQARAAQSWLLATYGYDWMKLGYTYIFEWVAPDNRIVVDYGDRRELVLLGRQSVHDPTDFDYTVSEWDGSRAKLAFVNNRQIESAEVIKQNIRDDEEGWVVHFPSINRRLKIKGEQYVARHRVRTGLNTYKVWEALRDGTYDELRADVDEEARLWMTNVASDISKRRFVFGVKVRSIYTRITEGKGTDLDAKAFAQRVFADEDASNHKSFMFALHQDKQEAFEQMSWLVVKPATKNERFSSGLGN